MKGHYPGRLYKVIVDGQQYADEDGEAAWTLTPALCIALFIRLLSENPRPAYVEPAGEER